MAEQGQREFFLVAEFTRSKIRLTEDSVGTILLSCFGGRASLFKVQKISAYLFKFSVSSINVGFAIYNGGNVSVPEFNLGFLLWGPNVPKLHSLTDPDQDEGWILVSRARNSNSYANAVRAPRYINQSTDTSQIQRNSRARSTVAVSTVFDRLQFPVVANNEAGCQDIQTDQNPIGAREVISQPRQAQPKAFCVRCLLEGHLRLACVNKIRCHNCKGWGHVASGCHSAFRSLVLSNRQFAFVSAPATAIPANDAIVVPSLRNAIT